MKAVARRMGKGVIGKNKNKNLAVKNARLSDMENRLWESGGGGRTTPASWFKQLSFTSGKSNTSSYISYRSICHLPPT